MSNLVPCATKEATVVRIGATEYAIRDGSGPYPCAHVDMGSVILREEYHRHVEFMPAQVMKLRKLGALEFLKPREPKTVTLYGKMIKSSPPKGFLVDYSAAYATFEPGTRIRLTMTEILGGTDEN